MSNVDLSMFTPSQIEALRRALTSNTDAYGRSVIRLDRQLHDLRLMPTKDDPRPTFFWSADAPRNVDTSKTYDYPRLMWHKETETEITVHSAEEEQQKSDRYTRFPPNMAAPDPEVELRQLLASLSPEDRAFLEEQQRKNRSAEIEAKMASMPTAVVDRVLNDTKAQKKKTA